MTRMNTSRSMMRWTASVSLAAPWCVSASGNAVLLCAIDLGGEVPAVGVEIGKKDLIDRLAALEVDEHPVHGADAPARLDLLDLAPAGVRASRPQRRRGRRFLRSTSHCDFVAPVVERRIP